MSVILNESEITLEAVMKSKKSISKKLKEIQIRIDELQNERMMLFKSMAQINKHLKNLCDHDWIRESYLYSPLYCKKCGVEK